jgi:NADPH2:quinone reductase
MIGFMDGSKATLDLATFLFKRISLRAFTLRARPDDFKAAIARAIRGKVWPLIEQQKIKPIVHSTFGFEEAHRAHELMESGGHIGKIVLIIK